MSKKISIAKAVDTDKLAEQINIYEAETNERPYIFANDETIKALEEVVFDSSARAYTSLPLSCPVISVKKTDCLAGRYEGYKLFCNNELSFGEVELR